MKLKDFLNEIRKRAEKDKGICADFEAQETWHNKNISIDEKYDVEYVGKKGQKCPSCRSPISIDEFKDEKSRREFKISGFCQNCQNEIWGEPKGEFQEEEIGDDDVISVGETVNFRPLHAGPGYETSGKSVQRKIIAILTKNDYDNISRMVGPIGKSNPYGGVRENEKQWQYFIEDNMGRFTTKSVRISQMTDSIPEFYIVLERRMGEGRRRVQIFPFTKKMIGRIWKDSTDYYSERPYRMQVEGKMSAGDWVDSMNKKKDEEFHKWAEGRDPFTHKLIDKKELDRREERIQQRIKRNEELMKLPLEQRRDEEGWLNLGIENAWSMDGEERKILSKCKHVCIEKKLNPSGTYREIECPECKIRYRVDSSD